MGLRLFQNKVLTKTFGHNRKEIVGGWNNCTMESFIFILLTIFYWSDKIRKG
jgi:hypothetical protein